VTSPHGTASVSELSSIQTVGADASGPQTTLRRSVGEPQRLVKESRAPERFGSHLAMKMSKSISDSTSGGSHLVRDQGEDLW
jgi:hypothetical protein